MKRIIVLIITITLAATLRLVVLNRRPAGFTWDEAALGYNAYSLLKSGRDEYGKVLPIVFKSFGDYKPGLYVYFTVPSIATFGLNEFATRLPSAVVGVLLIAVVFFWARELVGVPAALLTSLSLAINPWAIHFSRGAWEANLALFLTTLGGVLFSKKRYLLAVVFLGLTMWTYQGAKLFTPLILIALIIVYRPQLNFRRLVGATVLGLGFLLPIILGWGGQSGRLKVFSVFAYRRSEEAISQILHQDKLSIKNRQFYLFHGESYDQLRAVVHRFSNYFSPYFLFFAGDWTNGRHAIPYFGYFYPVEILTLVWGGYCLIRRPSRSQLIIWLWLILAPLPAALSRDVISGVRSLTLVIPLTLLSGMGWAQVARHKYVSLVCVAAMLFLVIYFLDLYFIHSPYFTAPDWLAAYGPALQLVKQHVDEYQKVVITNQLGQPYIFTLFYLQVDPRMYQSQAQLVENTLGDVGQVTKFGKFEFRPIYVPAEMGVRPTLLVGGQTELTQQQLVGIPNLVRLGEFNYPNNTVGLKVVGLK